MENCSLSEIIFTNTNLSGGNDDSLAEMDKENVDSSVVAVGKQHKSSRMSLLMSLDPLNPYSPGQCGAGGRRERVSMGSAAAAAANPLDQSWNFIGLDNASPTNAAVSQCRIDDDSADPFQPDVAADFLCHSPPPCSRSRDSIHSRSPLTDVSSSLDESGVAVDALLPISPMKQYVDKSEHDKLRKCLRSKQLEWDSAERAYRDEIAALQAKLTTELRLAAEEKDAVISDLVRENEENLEALRTTNARVMRDKQAEIDRCAAEIAQLREEITYLNCAQLASDFLVDEYNDALEAAVHKHGQDMEAIAEDNRQMEAVLNKYLSKLGFSQTVIAKQLENERVLREQLAKTDDQIDQLQSELARLVGELATTVGSSERDIVNVRADSERKLKRKEIRIAILENAEANLKSELELRIRERDQFKKNLADLLEQS